MILHCIIARSCHVGWGRGLTIHVSNEDLGRGIDQVDELWVGITDSEADSEALTLLLEGAVRQNEDGDARHAIV